MIPRFHFHGEAVGFGGKLTLPFDEIIPVQASCALPDIGGYGSARVENFRHRDVISVRAAFAQVGGGYSQKDDSWDTLATVTIEGLNILNVVTADVVVARITSKHPNNPGLEPSITPVGCYFQGLRIAGQPVAVDIADDIFNDFDTATKVRNAYSANTNNFRTNFNAMTLWGQSATIPADLRVHLPWCTVPLSPPQIPPGKLVIPGTLVRNVPALTLPLARFGHVIQVPGFGVVRLAEIKISQNRLHVAMLHVIFGSVPEGQFICASGEGNGSDW